METVTSGRRHRDTAGGMRFRMVWWRGVDRRQVAAYVAAVAKELARREQRERLLIERIDRITAQNTCLREALTFWHLKQPAPAGGADPADPASGQVGPMALRVPGYTTRPVPRQRHQRS